MQCRAAKTLTSHGAVATFGCATTAYDRRPSAEYEFTGQRRPLGNKLVMLLSIIMGRMRDKTGDGSFEPHLEDMKKLTKAKKKRKGKPGLMSSNSSAALLAAARASTSGSKTSKANLRAARALKKKMM